MTVIDRTRKWTPEEVAYVMRHYGPMTARQVAQQLGRSRQAVINFMRRYEGRSA